MKIPAIMIFAFVGFTTLAWGPTYDARGGYGYGGCVSSLYGRSLPDSGSPEEEDREDASQEMPSAQGSSDGSDTRADQVRYNRAGGQGPMPHP